MFMLAQMLSVGTGVAGAVLEGESNAMAAEERARADKFNAVIAEQEAASELESARADSSDFRRAQSARVAASRARASGSGFALEGSPMLIDEAALTEIEFTVSRRMHAGQVKAHRLKQESSLLKRHAKVEGINARLARHAGTISAIGTAASGTANMIQSMATQQAEFK